MRAHGTKGQLSRRAFVSVVVGFGATVAGLTTSSCGLGSAAHSGGKIPTMGVLTPDTRWWSSIAQGLGAAGWIEGQNITIEWRSADTDLDRLPSLGVIPTELPVEQATLFDLAVNQTTAQGLGLTIPPSFAAQVTEWLP
jgi:hypothetical protein